jgi:hypothetical protein
MEKREIIAATLAQWGLVLSEAELDQLVPAYDNLQVWQQVVENMLHSRPMVEGISFPMSEPLLTHTITSTAEKSSTEK